MTQYFTKAGTPAQISWEAQCLAWLDAAAGAQVVRVLQWDAGQLVEEKLKPARTTAAMAEAFGRGLAFGGHGETDLAMLALFGCPQLRVVEDAYAEAAGSAPDWRLRSGLHQLHPLLVHAELFDSGYGRQAVEVAHAYA